MLRTRFWHKLLLFGLDAALFLVWTIILMSVFEPFFSAQLLLTSPGYLFVWGSLMICTYVFGTYEVAEMDRKTQIFTKLLVAGLFTVGVILVVHFLGGKERSGIFSRTVLLGSLAVFFVSAYILRVLARGWVQRTWSKQRWLFLVSDSLGRVVEKDLSKIKKKPEAKIVSVGSDLSWEQFIKEDWTFVVVGGVELPPEMTNWLVRLKFSGVQVVDLVRFYEVNFLKVPLFCLKMDWFSVTQGFQLVSSGVSVRLKRLSDVILSLILLLASAPILFLLWILIPLESPGPAFFRQIRTGKNGREFYLLKFRSMRLDAEKDGPQWAKEKDPRITKWGKWIRTTRLDELPQLWNVLKGEMSLVGPRPERPEFNAWLSKEIPFYEFRHEVRPGLTGWAQIHYPYGASLDDALEKLQFELYYMKNSSLIMDVLIIFKTVGVVVFRMGR